MDDEQAKVWIEVSVRVHGNPDRGEYQELVYTVKRQFPGNEVERVRTFHDYPSAQDGLHRAYEDTTNILKVRKAGAPVVIKEMVAHSERHVYQPED